VSKRHGRLPLKVKAGYGTAEMGMSSVEVMLQIYLLVFYTGTVGLRAELAGIALALAVLWDAVTDPAMGVISDHTNSRWGRRRPYIFIGGIWLAFSFILLFSTPEFSSQTGKFFYLLLGYMLVNTGMTLINVPHSALGGELSFDPNERTEIFGWRLVFKNIGFLIGTILPGVLLTLVEGANETQEEYAAREYSSYVLGVITFLSVLITLYSVRKIDQYRPRVRVREAIQITRALRNYFAGLWSAAGNKVFFPLLLAFAIAQVGRTMNASLALYFYQFRLGLGELEVVLYILGLFMVVLTISIPFWVWIARRLGKKRPAFWGALFVGVTTCFIYPLLPPEQLWAPMVFASVLAGFAVGSIILFDSLVADVVDYDELRTGQHREGLYFGCWLMATKVARAGGLMAAGFTLDRIGFVEGVDEQAPEVGWRIALLFGPGVGFFFIIAALVFLFMPLTPERHHRVQVLLRRKQHRAETREAQRSQHPTQE